MVVRVKVKTLVQLSLEGVEGLGSYLCYYISHSVTPDKKSVFLNPEQTQRVVEQYVERLRDYLWQHVVCYSQLEVFHHFLEGIISAIEIMKSKWKLNTKMPEFTLQVWAMTKVSEVLHYQHLQQIDLENVPKMMRGTLMRNLHKFPELKKLVFGSSTGDMTIHITKGGSLYTSLCSALAHMDHLVHFSLQYNSTQDILLGLLNARSTLKILDIEHSVMVSDACVPLLLQFTHLTQLSIAKTKLTSEGQAQLIYNLKHLLLLPRGDFLCDALEWIDYENGIKVKPFALKNFWASEVYYFHTTEQMQLTSKMCPHIEDMLFMYQDRYTCQLEVLALFRYLSQLELWGGDFYVDNFMVLLSDIGHNLIKLDLHHLDNLDLRAICAININCPRLKILKFSGCNFVDRLETLDEDDVFQMNLNRRTETELMCQLVPWFDMKELLFASECPRSLLVTILSLCLNLTKLTMGTSCLISDDCFDQVFLTNKFQYLSELEIRKTDLLTMKTISNLLLYCDNMHSILDLEGWSQVSQQELDELIEHMRTNNINIKFTESHNDSRYVSLYQICQSALKEKFPRVSGWDGER